MKEYLSAISAIALNVGLFATFIGVFFFTFGAYIERLVLKRQIKYILQGFAGDIKAFASASQWHALCESVNALPAADTSNDQQAEEKNDALLKETLVLFGTFLAVMLLLIAILWFVAKGKGHGYAFNMKHMALESAGLLFIIAAVEVGFYSLVVANYKSVDANFIKGILVDNASTFADA